jgi:predicted nucleic acid-binding protein
MLLDTSGLLCYFDRRDPRHEEAGLLFDTSPTLLTHSYILAEFIPLCHSRRLDSGEAIGFSLRLLGNRDIEVVWVDDDLHRAALALLQARSDKDYSLCDAVSFVLMRARGLHDALTTDHHFEQEGFVRLLER